LANIYTYNLLPQTTALERVDSPAGRRYVDRETGKSYISVTTLLGRLPQKQKMLADWRRRVGDVEADRVMYTASARGSRVHDLLERHLLSDNSQTPTNSFDADIVAPMISCLRKNVSTIFGTELQMFSDELGVAGTSDLICNWADELAIGDFKTSRRPKKREDIFDYFLQGGAYGIMLQERYNMCPKKIVILMHVDHHSPALFVEDADRWMGHARKIFPRLAAA